MKYMKLGSKPDVFQSDGRFVATELDTDITINVGDVKFHLHKKLVAATNEENGEEISIHDIPGGPAAFEICAKFCYGMVVTLNAYNMKSQSVPKDWWVEDLCELKIDSYKQVIVSIKMKGKFSNEVIGEALKAYAYRRIPGLTKGTVSYASDAIKYQSVLETIVWLLPSEPHSVSCSFLLKLLRAGCVLECGERSKKELIKRIGRQLEEASIVDLLFPAAAGDSTVYNVDLVLCIVEEFIMQTKGIDHISEKSNQELIEVRRPTNVSGSTLIAVTKLIDGYLAEIAKDPNLPLTKFIELAEMFPALSRPVHDGLLSSYCHVSQGAPRSNGLQEAISRRLHACFSE